MFPNPTNYMLTSLSFLISLIWSILFKLSSELSVIFLRFLFSTGWFSNSTRSYLTSDRFPVFVEHVNWIHSVISIFQLACATTRDIYKFMCSPPTHAWPNYAWKHCKSFAILFFVEWSAFRSLPLVHSDFFMASGRQHDTLSCSCNYEVFMHNL